MQQNEALEVMKLGYNVYLTGEAGTGKTFVLNKYIQFLKKKHIPVAITASTGIAATHLDGVTIDSWSGLGIRDEMLYKEARELIHKHHLKKRLENARVLIIDEISMIPGKRFDAYDLILRVLRGTDRPFGGLQIILSGDLFQLPPVTKTRTIDYIFDSKAWHELKLHVCYLDTPRRQTDPELLRVLSNIRDGLVSDRTRHILTETRYHEVKGDLTKLYTHNVDVDAINKEQLEHIGGDIHEYSMTSYGPDELTTMMKRSCLAPELLQLKKGALVMFVRNNYQKQYVNGTQGQVIGFTRSGLPRVKTLSGQKIEVEPVPWTISDNDRTVSQITQIPLRLAWAITIHKSQGMTLDATEIDLSKSFVPGMGYVALSRVRSLKKLRLLGINDMALRINPEVAQIDRQLKQQSVETAQWLKHMGWIRRWLDKRKFIYWLTS